MSKNLDKQYHGAINAILGYGYEVMIFVGNLIDMLVQKPDDTQITRITRTKQDSNVDDIVIETKNPKSKSPQKIFYQCRRYISRYNKALFKDLFAQFQNDQNNIVCIVTQNKNREYANLTQDARKFEYQEFINRLQKDSQLPKQKEKFKTLCSWLSGDAPTDKPNAEFYEIGLLIYKFLKNFQIFSEDDIKTKTITKNRLKDSGYNTEQADKIFSAFYQKADDYNWQGKEITIDDLKKELKNIGVEYISQEKPKISIDLSTPQKTKKKELLPLLKNPEVRFFEKLNYILDLISNPHKANTKEVKESLEIIRKDNTLSWHFLKNLKSPDWFKKIKDTIIKSIIDNRIDSATKYQLLNYFEICADKYSNEIIPLLIGFEKNTKNPNILAAFVRSIRNLKPSKKEKLNPIWQILARLSEHQHPWVRKEIPRTLKALAEYDLDKSLNLLEKVILFKPVPRDVTQRTPTLALTFQGRDNENWVFEQASKTLRELMTDKRFVIKALDFAIRLEINSIKERSEKGRKVASITLDYSYIWLSNTGLDKVDYEYDRRKRFALEIENCLKRFADSDIKLTEKILDKLLQTKYEVFYLTIIKVLIEHTDKYLQLTEGIVFNTNLWKIHNIQNYFLQTLIGKYFNIKQNRLSEYVRLVESLNYKKDKKRTDYLKQDLFVSIPPKFRTEKIDRVLKQLEKKLKTPAKIEKSFVITSWVGPRPDIEIAELKKKDDDELVKVMEDCTAGRRKTDAYDLSSVFSQLIRDNPDRLSTLLDKIRNKQIDQRFSGEMIRVYIEVKKTNPQDILNIFWKLQKTDTWARTEIARFINEEYRKEGTSKIGKQVLKQVKAVLFELSDDKDPDDDETIKSNNPCPEDAITRGINSVRRVVTEGLVILLHYFPQDKEIIEKLKLLAKDKTRAVRATLIYNLKFLITKNYTLCKNVVNQFKDERNPEIDFALINYFASLDPHKFQANKEFIKLLFNSSNKEIQKNLGELIGHRYVNGFNIEELVESIIKQQRGETETRRSLAFVFESRLGEQIAIKRHERIIGYLKRLLDPDIEPDFEVRERASFVFERNNIQTKYFDILDKNNIFNTLLKDKRNIRAQNHLINYLQRCISVNESLERCVEILHAQVMEIEGILGDDLIVKKIAGILNKVFESKVNKKTKDLSEEIFDKGLERGWDEFYTLFQKLRKQ